MNRVTSADQPPGRRAEGVRRTRRSILDAARRHLVESGYHRLSLEEVAADAGVTRVTIYRHFESKLGLLDAIGADLAEQAGLVARTRAAVEVDDPVRAVTGLVGELCRFWSTDPAVFRRLISLAAVDPAAQQVVDSRERWRYRQIAAQVRRLAAADRLRPPFRQRQATALVGTVTGFPSCDEIAGRLGTPFRHLDRLLLPLLGSVLRLD